MKKLFKSKFYKSLEPIIGKCNQKTHTITSRLFQHKGIIDVDIKEIIENETHSVGSALPTQELEATITNSSRY